MNEPLDVLDWPERTLQEKVMTLARSMGWLAVHFGGDQSGKAWGDAAGFPDLLLIHVDPPNIWFRELKSTRGKLSPRQERWATKLSAEGLNYDVWRPADWPDIVQALTFGRGAAQ